MSKKVYFSDNEKNIYKKFDKLKKESGSHSPSMISIKEIIPEIDIKVDACFLSNPYATDLFLYRLQTDLLETNQIRDILEFYPSQNSIISKSISNLVGIDSNKIIIGNGAIEIIQTVLKTFVKDKIIVILPTFSSYYEFINEETEFVPYYLSKKNDYKLNIENYISFVKKEKPNTIVIINPNNPNGAYINYDEMKIIVEELSFVKNIIVDESFIHFAFEDEELKMNSIVELVKEHSNLIVIKSMSKDFGIAGIRAGYGIMDEKYMLRLLKSGFLWNSNGISEYFFRLYGSDKFYEDYEVIRKRYILESQSFFRELSKINGIKTYDSKANFILVELLDGLKAFDFALKLLIKYGIYARIGDDKIGLEGQYLRIASRKKEDNDYIIKSIKHLLENEIIEHGE